MHVQMFVSNPFTNDPRVHNGAESLIQLGYGETVIACDWQKQTLQHDAPIS